MRLKPRDVVTCNVICPFCGGLLDSFTVGEESEVRDGKVEESWKGAACWSYVAQHKHNPTCRRKPCS